MKKRVKITINNSPGAIGIEAKFDAAVLTELVREGWDIEYNFGYQVILFKDYYRNDITKD